MKATFRKDLQITSVKTNSDWNKLQAHCFLQDSRIERPVVNSYVSSKFLNTKNSLQRISSDIIENKRNIEDKLGKVGINKDLSNTYIHIDNLPGYLGLKYRYLFSNTSIDISYSSRLTSKNFDFIKIPKEFCENSDVKRMYEKTLLGQVQKYRDLRKTTLDFVKKFLRTNEKSRTELNIAKTLADDILEYLMPLGLNSRVSMNISADEMNSFIKYLLSSSSLSDNELGEVLINLLKEGEQSIPREISFFIDGRYSEDKSKDFTKDVLKYLKSDISKQPIGVPASMLEGLTVKYMQDPTEELVTHYEYLLNPLGSSDEIEITNEMQEDLGQILFDNDDDISMNNVGSTGGIKVAGFSSVFLLQGLLNDCGSGFIPIFEQHTDLDKELDRSDNSCFFLPYVFEKGEMKSLKRRYLKVLREYYSEIKRWRELAKKCLVPDLVDEYTKYLLPKAHSTSYFLYFSADEFTSFIDSNLSSDDANIEEKILIYEVLRLISIDDLLWKPLLRKHIKPQIDRDYLKINLY